jgi:hypothetical protein
MRNVDRPRYIYRINLRPPRTKSPYIQLDLEPSQRNDNETSFISSNTT